MLHCAVLWQNTAVCLSGPGATAGGTGQWAAPPTPPAQGPKVNPFMPKADAPSQHTSQSSRFQGAGPAASNGGQQSSQVHHQDSQDSLHSLALPSSLKLQSFMAWPLSSCEREAPSCVQATCAVYMAICVQVAGSCWM